MKIDWKWPWRFCTESGVKQQLAVVVIYYCHRDLLSVVFEYGGCFGWWSGNTGVLLLNCPFCISLTCLSEARRGGRETKGGGASKRKQIMQTNADKRKQKAEGKAQINASKGKQMFRDFQKAPETKFAAIVQLLTCHFTVVAFRGCCTILQKSSFHGCWLAIVVVWRSLWE